MTECNSLSSPEQNRRDMYDLHDQEVFNEYLQKNKGRKRKKVDEYDLNDEKLIFQAKNIPKVKMQEDQGQYQQSRTKKKDGRVKQEHSQSNESQTGHWQPVNQEERRRKIKFQYHSDSLYPTKIRRKKLPDVTPEDDPEQYTRRLMQMARQYHKHLRQEVQENIRLKKEGGIKQQPYQWVSIDKNMNTYPLDNERMRFKKFTSVSDFLNELKKQQQEILTQINDPNMSSVFYQSLQASIKKTNGSKQFHNFKCKIPKCAAILKCSVEPEGCDLYLIRNKHNHTITGQMLEPKDEIKQPQTVVIDEHLHQMFGLYKGVRSETQNVKYKDPQQMKIHQAQQRAQYNQKCKIRKKNKKLGIPLEEEPYKLARKPNKKKKSQKSRAKSLRRKRNRVPLSKYQDEPEFINIPEQLIERNYRIEYMISSPESRFPQFMVLASKQMMSLLIKDVNQVRMSMLQQAMKLHRKKCPSHPLWSIVLFTTLNIALKPVVLAVGLSSIFSQDYLSKLLSLFLKLCPSNPKYFITQNKPQIYTQIKKGIQKQNMLFHYLLDSNSTLSSLQTLWNNAKKSKILGAMMDPINYYKHEEMIHHLRKQTMILEKFEQFRKHSFIPEGSPAFFGFKISLSPEADIVQQIKAKMRFHYYRHSMKRQFAEMMTIINNYNNTNQSYITTEFNLEVQKIFNDSQLQPLRNVIASRVLNQFCLQYRDADKLSFQKQDDQTYLFEEGNLVVKNGICGCQYRQVTGIPCRHMIKVLKSAKQDYVKWINQRWLICPEVDQSDKKSQGSSSRRKRIPHSQGQQSQMIKKKRKRKEQSTFQVKELEENRTKQEQVFEQEQEDDAKNSIH